VLYTDRDVFSLVFYGVAFWDDGKTPLCLESQRNL